MGKAIHSTALIPETDEEWQEAVNAADFSLHVDSARQYGLIETEMRFDID